MRQVATHECLARGHRHAAHARAAHKPGADRLVRGATGLEGGEHGRRTAGESAAAGKSCSRALRQPGGAGCPVRGSPWRPPAAEPVRRRPRPPRAAPWGSPFPAGRQPRPLGGAGRPGSSAGTRRARTRGCEEGKQGNGGQGGPAISERCSVGALSGRRCAASAACTPVHGARLSPAIHSVRPRIGSSASQGVSPRKSSSPLLRMSSSTAACWRSEHSGRPPRGERKRSQARC